MKSLIALSLLISISACGVREKSEKSVTAVAQPLKCVIPTAINGVFTPVIKVDQSLVDKIMVDLQNRPFNRNSFWNIISRENRLEMNLALSRDLKIPEDIIFRGFVLFMENYVNNPGQNYFLKTSQYHVRFVIRDELSANDQETCDKQDEVLSQIDVSRLIPSASHEMRLYCTVKSYFIDSVLRISIYQNHVIIETEQEKVLYTGGEIIRNDTHPEIRMTALDSKQRMLTLKLDKNEDAEKKRKVAILFSGKTTAVEGSGTCVSLRK